MLGSQDQSILGIELVVNLRKYRHDTVPACMASSHQHPGGYPSAVGIDSGFLILLFWFGLDGGGRSTKRRLDGEYICFECTLCT